MSMSAAHVELFWLPELSMKGSLGMLASDPHSDYKAEILTANQRFCICCILGFYMYFIWAIKIHILNAQQSSNCFYISASKSTIDCWNEACSPLSSLFDLCCWLHVKKQKGFFCVFFFYLKMMYINPTWTFNLLLCETSWFWPMDLDFFHYCYCCHSFSTKEWPGHTPCPPPPLSGFSLSLLFLWTMFCTLVNRITHSTAIKSLPKASNVTDLLN